MGLIPGTARMQASHRLCTLTTPQRNASLPIARNRSHTLGSALLTRLESCEPSSRPSRAGSIAALLARPRRPRVGDVLPPVTGGLHCGGTGDYMQAGVFQSSRPSRAGSIAAPTRRPGPSPGRRPSSRPSRAGSIAALAASCWGR